MKNKERNVSDTNANELEGHRLPLFSYTHKEVLSVSKFDKKVKDEIERIKSLPEAQKSGWIVSSRPPNTIYTEDCVSELKKVGNKTKKKLENAGIFKVHDLMFSDLTPDEINRKLLTISDATAGSTQSKISVSKLKSLHLQAKTAQTGTPPPLVDHQSAENPYLSRYDEENWMSEIKKVRGMKKFCDIRDLVRHIHDATRKFFKGTKYENTYLFYHDALSQMTDKDCKEWMRQEGILERWIRPELGMNDEIVIIDNEGNEKKTTAYKGRPVGDCPELMPLDNSLFRDFRCDFDDHVTLTCQLPRNDPRRFSKGTPKTIEAAVRRLWDPQTGVSPPPHRIVQDINRVLENVEIVVREDGAVVDGVVDRNGHRRKSTGDRRHYTAPHADQTAVPLDNLVLHADCKEVVWELYGKEIENWYGPIFGPEPNPQVE